MIIILGWCGESGIKIDAQIPKQGPFFESQNNCKHSQNQLGYSHQVVY